MFIVEFGGRTSARIRSLTPGAACANTRNCFFMHTSSMPPLTGDSPQTDPKNAVLRTLC